MRAEVTNANWIAKDLVPEAAPGSAAARNTPCILQLRASVEIEDVLAILRTAIVLARQSGASLFLDLREAATGRTGSANSGTEMHLGSAPCTAMLSALLHSVEQRLRTFNPDLNRNFLVEFGFSVEMRGLLLRIRASGPFPQSRSQLQASEAENPKVSTSSQFK